MSQTSEIRTSSPEGVRVTFGRLQRLCRKELREILRDRRTIVTLVLMPLLAYPLISIAFQRFVLTAAVGVQRDHVRVMTLTLEERDNLSYAVQIGEGAWLTQNRPAEPIDANGVANGDSGSDTSERNGSGNDGTHKDDKRQDGKRQDDKRQDDAAKLLPSPDIQWAHAQNPKEVSLAELVREGRVDVAVDLARGSPGNPLICQFTYRIDSPIAIRTVTYLKSRIRAFNQVEMQNRLRHAGESGAVAFSFEEKTIGESASVSMSLLTLLPLILVLMTVTGAVYPAIDLTAGERERGTLELLIATPMPRIYILLAKYVAVMVVALLTATINLMAMTAAVYFSGLGQALFRDGDLTPATLGIVGLLLLVFACFFSALLLAVTSIARSFKEAQAYLIPLMLFSISPGMIALVPNIELTLSLAIVPLLNMVLLARDMVGGGAPPHLLALAIASTAVYTVIALHFAAMNFGQNVISDTSADGWARLWGSRKSATSLPTLSVGIIFAILLFHFQFVLTGELARLIKAGYSVVVLVPLMGVGTLLLFGILPSIYVLIMKHSFLGTFQLKRFRWQYFLGAALLGCSLWLIELTVLSGAKLIEFNEEQQAQAVAMIQSWRELPAVVVFIVIAILPALFEELFFRGFLLTSMRSAGNLRAIVLTAVIFAGFHIISGGLVRFIPSMFVGLILGWIAIRSGSILPGIALHVANNGILALLTYYSDDLVAAGWIDADLEGIPVPWLVVGSLLAVAGSALCVFAARKDAEKASES
ncbi:MAG: sodium transport system permease protein [Pirellulaceae bacterium]|jgi:sodium transport system permease protein